jgi:hypothetical protein
VPAAIVAEETQDAKQEEVFVAMRGEFSTHSAGTGNSSRIIELFDTLFHMTGSLISFSYPTAVAS